MTGTSHGCLSRGLVGSQSPACHWLDIKSGVSSRITISPNSGCRGTSLRLDALRVCEFNGVFVRVFECEFDVVCRRRVIFKKIIVK